MTPAITDRLRPSDVAPLLTTRWLGRHYHYCEETASTNSAASELARDGAAEGTVVVAEAQTRGRGRLGRAWVSPAYQNLYLSVILRPHIPSGLISQVSLMAGVAACEAMREWCPATIKWPNDILVAGRKLAGILAELEGEGPARFVVLGIGVNLNSGAGDLPPELRDKATSIRIETGAPVDRPRFLARILSHLEVRYDQLQHEGFGPIAEAWGAESALIGQTIRVEEPTGQVSGVVIGLDADGALRLRLESGAEHRIVAGDVTVVGGYPEINRS
jgi:BirA family biotin operon repressor/biotin-[acetyl-CoA-carboxylase] ligase